MNTVAMPGFASLVEAASKRKNPANDDMLAMMYGFFLRALGDPDRAKLDMVRFLHSGNLPLEVLTFAQRCVDEDRSGENENGPEIAEVDPAAQIRQTSRPSVGAP